MGRVWVTEWRPITEDVLGLVVNWQAARGIEPLATTDWLELHCENDAEFARSERRLLVATSPIAVEVGDVIEVEQAEVLGSRLPDVDDAGGVPHTLVLANSLTRSQESWVVDRPPATEGKELFTVTDAKRMGETLKATANCVVTGIVGLTGPAGNALWVTALDRDVVAWGEVAADVSVGFSVWLAPGTYIELGNFARRSQRLNGIWRPSGHLVIRNSDGSEYTCELAPPPAHQPSALAEDHFVAHAYGRAEAIRIDLPGGLGGEAIALIAQQRPRGSVRFEINGENQLIITSGPGGAERAVVDGPGFSAADGRRNILFDVPYPVAVAIHNAARRGVVDVMVDDRHGRLTSAGAGVRLEWARCVDRTSAQRGKPDSWTAAG